MIHVLVILGYILLIIGLIVCWITTGKDLVIPATGYTVYGAAHMISGAILILAGTRSK